MLQHWLRSLISGIRFGQFISVGAFGAVCDFLVLSIIVEFTTIPIEVAKLASAESAVIVMFILNERWTFAHLGTEGLLPVLRRFLTSNIVRVWGILVATGVLSILVRQFGMSYLIANAAGIGAGFIMNYLLESLVTWRVQYA
ncbi:MAG: GtrA family protein [Halobacteriaceae archaeon]